MFPDNQNNTDRENFNQNNNPVTPGFNQTPQQPIQPDPNQFQQPGQPQQFQQPQSPLNQQPPGQLPPVQPQQPLATQQAQPNSFNPLQQMENQETKPKKKPPNALLLTAVFIIILAIGVAVAMVLISGQSKAPDVSLNPSQTNKQGSGSQTDDDQDGVDPNAPQILDTTPVAQDFYDNYLAALRAKSQPKARLAVLHSYVKNNQDLTPSYQKKLSKATSVNQDPLLFGQKYIPSQISYGDPVAKKDDDKTAILPITVQFGSEKQVFKVTLTWQTSQTRAGYWQISKVSK